MTNLPTRVRRWLVEAALPLWSTIGVDHERGGFIERLTAAGAPDLTVAKRVRVQARQIYVFSHARLLGLMPHGDAIAAYGHEFVMRHGFPGGIDQGVVHSFDRDGAVRDTKRDTYDHAFLLFAWSWFYRATGRADVRHAMIALGDAIWAILKHPSGHGFLVDDQGSEELHQNPHMHLFEAVLAAYDATGEAIFLERARELFELFRSRMFDVDLGLLREFYDADWCPAAGFAGRIVEPGHQAEWVWLLKWYVDRTGEPLAEEARRLFAFVHANGRPSGTVLLCDELWDDGTVRKASTRSWPQTEALKAEIAIAEAEGLSPGPYADAIVAALFDTFLDRAAVEGAWIDWVDVDGASLTQAIPASTFYHLFLAMSEYLRVRG